MQEEMWKNESKSFVDALKVPSVLYAQSFDAT